MIPLQVDNMYTGWWAGGLSAGGGGGKLNKVREHRRWGRGIFIYSFFLNRYSGEGEAWLKESTPMETNKILF